MSNLPQLIPAQGARGELTFIRVDWCSGKEVQRQGDVPHINSALALVIVLMKRWSVDHSCVIDSTSGLCSPYQVHSASNPLKRNIQGKVRDI